MIKTTGLLLVLGSSIGIGAYFSHRENTSLIHLRQLISFIHYIKKQIEYFNTPMCDIYQTFDTRDDTIIGFITEVSKSGWGIALENTKALALPKNIISLLEEFGTTLGKSEKKDQISLCNYYATALEKEYEELSKKLPERKKVSLALGIYTGLMLVLLFM